MKIVKPMIPCKCGKAMVYAEGDACAACQERNAKAMDKLKQDMFGTEREGWKSLGGDGRWMRSAHR